MFEKTPDPFPPRTHRAAAACWRPLWGAAAVGVCTLAGAADGVRPSPNMSVCPPAICDPEISKEPNPTPEQVIVPGDGIYRVLGTRVRVDDSRPGLKAVNFHICVSNESPNRQLTQVLVAAVVQPDAGAPRQLRSYLVSLAPALKPGETGCASGSIAAPFKRPLLLVAQPAN